MAKGNLLDNQRLITQLCGLERRTGRGGRDSIDHRPGAGDELANATCGQLHVARPETQEPLAFPIICRAPRQYFGDIGSGYDLAPHLDVRKTNWPVW